MALKLTIMNDIPPGVPNRPQKNRGFFVKLDKGHLKN
jgi:hypothetical protein